MWENYFPQETLDSSRLFPMLHFQSIINQQIISLLLHPATPLLHPSPTPAVNWHCSTHRACVIFLHMEWPIQLIPRQAVSSQPVRQAAREEVFFRSGPCCLSQSLVYASCSYDGASLIPNTLAWIHLFVSTQFLLVMPNWHTHTQTLIQTPPTSHFKWFSYYRTITSLLWDKSQTGPL